MTTSSILVQAARKSRQLTQARLAELTGIDQANVSHHERGRDAAFTVKSPVRGVSEVRSFGLRADRVLVGPGLLLAVGVGFADAAGSGEGVESEVVALLVDLGKTVNARISSRAASRCSRRAAAVADG